MTSQSSAGLHEVRTKWLHVQSEVAHLKLLFAGQRFREALRCEEEREDKYRPDQPRVPAGNSDGGQWTSDGGTGGGGFGASPSDTGDKPVQLALFQGYAAEKAAEAALGLYLYWASRNTENAKALLEFRAQEFLPGSESDGPAIGVRQLTREEVSEACPRHELVQNITVEAADRVRREGNYLGAAAYGTKVHSAIRDEVRSYADVNFKTEVSAKKSEVENYGLPGTIRVDVFENVGNGTVYVYDIKTGKSKLTLPRMAEIANNTHSLYPGTRRILIIEVRPK